MERGNRQNLTFFDFDNHLLFFERVQSLGRPLPWWGIGDPLATILGGTISLGLRAIGTCWRIPWSIRNRWLHGFSSWMWMLIWRSFDCPRDAFHMHRIRVSVWSNLWWLATAFHLFISKKKEATKDYELNTHLKKRKARQIQTIEFFCVSGKVERIELLYSFCKERNIYIGKMKRKTWVFLNTITMMVND